MTHAESVVRALIWLREAGESPVLTERRKPVAPPGNYFVRIALVANVKNEPVHGAVVDAVERYGQFDRAEVRGEVAARLCNVLDEKAAYLRAERFKLITAQLFYIVGTIYLL